MLIVNTHKEYASWFIFKFIKGNVYNISINLNLIIDEWLKKHYTFFLFLPNSIIVSPIISQNKWAILINAKTSASVQKIILRKLIKQRTTLKWTVKNKHKMMKKIKKPNKKIQKPNKSSTNTPTSNNHPLPHSQSNPYKKQAS